MTMTGRSHAAHRLELPRLPCSVRSAAIALACARVLLGDWAQPHAPVTMTREGYLC